MNNLKIFVMTHKPFDVPDHPLYQPLHVGRAGAQDLGYLGDDTGENISDMNCYFSELTGLYWLFKNYRETPYLGVCHYRRYLLDASGHAFTEKEALSILKEHDLITTKLLELNFSYAYGFSKNHEEKDLAATGEVIFELFPDYYDTFDTIIHANRTYFGNMMICSLSLFQDYCSWLFSILFEVQKRISIDTYDSYHKRVFGFLSEILLYVYTSHNRLRVYESMVGMVGEKKETKEVKERIGTYFLKKDVAGAKKYFLTVIKQRPDILMEASDILGELRLCLQIISTCEFELDAYGTCILAKENRLSKLLPLFSRLNRCVAKERSGELTEEDRTFLGSFLISQKAVEIARILAASRDRANVNSSLS